MSWEDIPGATGENYVLQEEDIGLNIRVGEIGVNAVGSTSEAFSNVIGPIQPEPANTVIANQNFETPVTGIDNGETWGVVGAVDPASTSTILRGAQSCRINGASGSITFDFEPRSKVRVFFELQSASRPGNAEVLDKMVQILTADGLTVLAALRYNAQPEIRLLCNGVSSSPSATPSANGAQWRGWLDFEAGGPVVLAMSQSTTRPSVDGGGDVYLPSTGALSDAGRVKVSIDDTADITVDHIIIQTGDIGDDPA